MKQSSYEAISYMLMHWVTRKLPDSMVVPVLTKATHTKKESLRFSKFFFHMLACQACALYTGHFSM